MNLSGVVLHLTNLLTNVDLVELLYKFNVLLSRKDLRHAVSRHLVRRLPVYVEAILLDLLANPVLVDINVFELSAKLVLLLRDYAHCLLVVTPNDRRLVELQRLGFELSALCVLPLVGINRIRPKS
jgi:hypothetical protein